MKFVIQQTLLNPDQLKLVNDAVSQYPSVGVELKPFVEEIFCSETLDGTDYIPYGSTLLTQMAAQRNWTGLFFDLDKLNYRAALANHRHMLNSGLFTVSDAIEFLKTQQPTSNWFIRPSNDMKQFSGQVLTATEIWVWLESMTLAIGGGSYYMPPTAEVVLCPPKDIKAEWRWFIIGGQIVSGSMYRAHNQLRKIRELDKAVIDEAQALADMWLPHECVVMDTALVDGEVKVVEFNCINSSGFYDNDIPTVFNALWKYCANN